MKATPVVAALALALVAAGCDQSDQPLPFAEQGAKTTKTVMPGTTTTVGTVAGASITFPAGAFTEPTTVSIEPVPLASAAARYAAAADVAATGGVSSYGTPVSKTFRVEPANAQLNQDASGEILLDSDAEFSRAWAATVVSKLFETSTPEPTTMSFQDVDTGGSWTASFATPHLGDFSVVEPPDWGFLEVTPGDLGVHPVPEAADLLAQGTDSVTIHCGGPSNPCAGLAFDASQNLLDQVADAAAIFPTVTGALGFQWVNATGQLQLDASIRVLLKSRASSENVGLHATITPTPSSIVTENEDSITVTNVHFVIRGSDSDQSASSDENGTLVIIKQGSGGVIQIRRDFQITGTSGASEAAWVRATIPVQIYQ